MSLPRPVTPVVAALASLAVIAGCTAVRTIQPTELSPPHTPARVWVTWTGGPVLVFDSPQLVADTLVGLVNGTPERVPLRKITTLRAREPSVARTAGLVLLTGATLTMYLLEKTASGGACSPCGLGASSAMSCPIVNAVGLVNAIGPCVAC